MGTKTVEGPHKEKHAALFQWCIKLSGSSGMQNFFEALLKIHPVAAHWYTVREALDYELYELRSVRPTAHKYQMEVQNL